MVKSKGLNKPLLNQFIDQSLHFSGAALVVLVITFTSPLWDGIVIGLALGFLRELTEGGNVFSKGSLLDILFWMLGGFLTMLLLTHLGIV